MLFQSFEFIIFFAIICVLTFILRKRAQQILLLCGSIFFYAWGSFVHLPLFALVIIWTYAYGILLEKKTNKSKFALAVGIIVAFIPLAICKYLPFLLGQMMPDLPWFIENITLPIGISFFTFQAVSYLIDVYRKRQAAERDLIVYSLFLSFFPQLVAGPIMRVPQLIPQLKEKSILLSERCRRSQAYGARLVS
jgi:alginate O-acetyltransferase complex protein AlgI